jgi:hypothetical protein
MFFYQAITKALILSVTSLSRDKTITNPKPNTAMNMDYDDLNDYFAYNRSNERAKLWAGFAVGVGVGVLIGILLAPDLAKKPSAT